METSGLIAHLYLYRDLELSLEATCYEDHLIFSTLSFSSGTELGTQTRLSCSVLNAALQWSQKHLHTCTPAADPCDGRT
jgi:hypothetical protein